MELTAMKELAKYRPMPSPISPVLKIISLKVSYLRAEWCSVVKERNAMMAPGAQLT
jgi:hypothetical protein